MKGQRYLLRADHISSYGADHLSVGVCYPDSTCAVTIPSQNLYVPSHATMKLGSKLASGGTVEVGGGGDLESDKSTLFHDIRVWDDVISNENIEALYLNDANNGGGYPTATGPWSHWRMNNLASAVQRATKAFKIQMEDALRSSDHVDYIRAHAYAGETLQKQNWAYLSSKTSKGLESYMESNKLVAQQGRATYKCATCHNINDWYCRISDDRSQVKACFFSDDAIQ
mgnify:FL=1